MPISRRVLCRKINYAFRWLCHTVCRLCRSLALNISIYLSIGINVRFAAMMADVGDGLL